MRTLELTDAVVAVTGGARGIGLATARAFRAAGARVVIGDKNTDAVAESAQRHDLVGLALDVTQEASYADFLARVRDRAGPVDVLVNNAGIMPVGPLVDYDEAIVQRTVEIDLLGVIRGCRLAAPEMIARRSGRIINVASIAGRLPAPGLSLYNAAKFGVVGFTEALDAELRPHGVRASSILPSFTRTALIDGLDERLASRAATPEQVADAIVGVARRHRLNTFVPRSMSATSTTGLVPGRVKSWLLSRPTYAGIFSAPDTAGRESYESEIRG